MRTSAAVVFGCLAAINFAVAIWARGVQTRRIYRDAALQWWRHRDWKGE